MLETAAGVLLALVLYHHWRIVLNLAILGAALALVVGIVLALGVAIYVYLGWSALVWIVAVIVGSWLTGRTRQTSAHPPAHRSS